MTYQPSNSLQSYVHPDTYLPDDKERWKTILCEELSRVKEALNDKTIGQYNTVELLNGEQYFTVEDPNAFRSVFRKVINFGALPNNTTKSVAHGITIDANTVMVRIYGTATDPSTTFVPIPYIDVATLGDGLELYIDGTNVNIKTTKDWSGFTTSLVILEYLKT